MKAFFVFLLVAALFTLPFTSASPAKLESRQGPAAITCAQNADCKAATSSWNYCQNTLFGIPPATLPDLTTCICSSGQGNSIQPDWFPKLKSCIQCIENAQEVPPDSVLTLLQAIEVDFCTTGNLTYDDFVTQAHKIAANAGLPLVLPQATFVSIQTGIPTSNLQTGISTADSCVYLTTYKISTEATAVTTAAPVVKDCNYDNCLRQAIQSENVVLPYCETYATSVDTATAGHPGYVSMCNNSPMSISSACTCLVSAQTPSQTPSQTQTTSIVPAESHTTTNGGIATTEAKPSIHLTTHWITTFIYITPGGQSSTAPETSSTSCKEDLSASSTQVVQPSTSKTSSSSHTSSSTPVQPATSTRTSSSASSKSSPTIPTSPTSTTKSSSLTPSSSTSTSAASAAVTWITLPASTEMKACAGSADCDTARNYYSSCSNDEVNGNQTLSWDCLCMPYIDQWKSSVANCGECVANALPVAPPGGYPSKILVPTLTKLMNIFCNQTSPSYKSGAISSLERAGLALTTDLESPVVFFNISLIDHPLPPNPPVSSSSSSRVFKSTTTTTTLVTVTASTSKTTSSSSNAPAHSGSSTGIHTTLSTKTTSSAQATPTKWITLPATEAMKQCQANACQPAAKIYNTCTATKPNGTNQDPIFNCFCTANKVQWQSTLSDCSTCIAAALPANNPGTHLQANDFNSNVEVTRQVFCNLTEADMANHTLAFLGAFGQVITTSFQSPVNFFNMTLLTAPIPPFAKRDAGLLPRKILGNDREKSSEEVYEADNS